MSKTMTFGKLIALHSPRYSVARRAWIVSRLSPRLYARPIARRLRAGL